MAELGIPELLIILAIILLVCGPGRVLDMASGLGQAIRAFRRSIRDKEDPVL